jgi:hypothetical protein
MTDAPDRTPKPTNRWRDWSIHGLTNARTASVNTWHWLRRSWGQLVASLQDEAPRSPSSASGPLVEQLDAPGLIHVPARGYVYAFYIRATFAWSSTRSLRAEVLSWYARYFLPHAIQKLTRLAADAARDLPPHRAADLERALQRALAADPTWTYPRGTFYITCQPDASVRLDPRIRPAVQPHIDRLVKLEHQFDEQLRQARYAEELSRRWAAILGEHVDGATDQPDQDLADAREHLLIAQRDAARWINELLSHHTPYPTEPLASPPIPPQKSRPRPAAPS